MTQFTDGRTKPPTFKLQLGISGVRNNNCQHSFCEHRFPPDYIEGPCVLLGVNGERMQNLHAPSRAISVYDSDAHSLVQPCVPDQTPPRSQLIQCDNDPSVSAAARISKFS